MSQLGHVFIFINTSFNHGIVYENLNYNKRFTLKVTKKNEN